MTYLLTATILLFAVWPAYALLLRYSDRYVLNRCLLLLVMAAVCALPFVSLPSPAPVATQSVRGTVSFLEESVRPTVASLPAERLASADELGTVTTMETVVKAPPTVTLPLIYGLGVGLLLLILGVRLVLILALHLRSRPNEDGTYRLLHPSASPGQAFTFGRNLYFSEDVPQDADFQHILAHERVHARQGHTLDILLSEFFLCLFWFHPAAWWLRNRTRANLEYLVDKAVVSGGADRRSYQLALVRQSQGAFGLALALPFSEPSLKSRIARMTGLPEYRVVALLAAVALVFWQGMTLLVVNGTVFGDEPPVGREYLEAAAHPGDPYYDYYQGLLPEELTSLEIYTSRMVTVDEYLQLRAILGQVPGAKLYVYKNQFDEGYSLELRLGIHEPAVATGLNPEPSLEDVSIMGIETDESTGQHLPVSITLAVDDTGVEGSSYGVGFNQKTEYYLNLNSFVLPDEVLLEDIGDEPFVYVNRERVTLIKQANEKVSTNLNGTEISEFGAADWPKVLVEGRSQPSPKQRIRVLLDLPANIVKPESFSHQTAHVDQGTYRKWYENLRHLKDQPTLAYYNDRPVELDFLLDNEFGEKSIIQHAVIYDTPMGRYAVQVLDDYPEVEAVMSSRAFKIDLSGADATPTEEINLYFRRLPTPKEVRTINDYLGSFPGVGLRVFQDCKNATGDYTLYLGDASGANAETSELAVGEVYNGPVRFSIKRDELGVPILNVHEPAPASKQALATEVYLMIDGVYVKIHPDNGEPYTAAELDQVPDVVSLKCKLAANGSDPGNGFWVDLRKSFWMYTYRSVHPEMMDGFNTQLKEHGLKNRPIFFYVNNRLVTEKEFTNYEGGAGTYVLMGTWAKIDDAPVILEIVD